MKPRSCLSIRIAIQHFLGLPWSVQYSAIRLSRVGFSIANLSCSALIVSLALSLSCKLLLLRSLGVLFLLIRGCRSSFAKTEPTTSLRSKPPTNITRVATQTLRVVILLSLLCPVSLFLAVHTSGKRGARTVYTTRKALQMAGPSASRVTGSGGSPPRLAYGRRESLRAPRQTGHNHGEY